ncbi:DUF1427 family protein [Otariodibacter sp.]|uniref:DUF1427 family protein n=1 Tax=Otariodibacter sp. TaxID=3030919 RepID=UPI00261EBDB8|nr:DUF1427 family protein [Otariodibacter sp.]
MKMYLLSFGVGIFVGVIYYALNVRSPAPPIVALLGLLGMLIGEQIIPVAKNMFTEQSFVNADQETNATKSALGELPSKHSIKVEDKNHDKSNS